MTGATLEFRFVDPNAEHRFLTEYLVDAWDRFESADYWDQGWFWRYSQFDPYDVGVDGGLVRLVFDGDPDGLVDAEADRWEEFGRLTEWAVTRYDDEEYESLLAQQRDAKGDVGGDYEYRYKPLTTRLALASLETFDGRLPPAPKPTESNPVGIGMYGLVHALFVQSGYTWYEENDAYLRGLESRIKSIETYRGEDAALEEYQRVCEELEAYGAELEAWLETVEAGSASV